MAVSSLVESLLAARGAMNMPPMNGIGHAGKGGSREYKYATLQDVLKCIMPPLIENGVLLYQSIEDNVLKTVAAKGDETMVLDSRKVNLSGTPQEQGSAETYAKRYALCTVFCIAGTEDDDGQAASAAPRAAQQDGIAISNAKGRMWAALQKWAELHGREPQDVLKGVQKRPDWSESADFFNKVAYEFEDDMNG